MTMSMQTIQLSHSKRSLMQRCGRAYYYHYNQRLQPIVQNATLGYGKTVHSALAAALTAAALFGTKISPVPIFASQWEDFTASNSIRYSSSWTADEMGKTAESVLRKFEVDWESRGWQVVCDKEGLPIIEREFRILLPGNIVYVAIIDALIRLPDGRIIVLDFKTPLTASTEDFAALSDQLLSYQIIVDAHAETLGINRVDGMMFYELTKVMVPKSKSRGEGPKIHASQIVPRRDDEAVQDWIRETQFVAQDIRSQRFTRRTRDSYDTGCNLCDFSKVCQGMSDPELRVRPSRHRQKAPVLEHTAMF